MRGNACHAAKAPHYSYVQGALIHATIEDHGHDETGKGFIADASVAVSDKLSVGLDVANNNIATLWEIGLRLDF